MKVDLSKNMEKIAEIRKKNLESFGFKNVTENKGACRFLASWRDKIILCDNQNLSVYGLKALIQDDHLNPQSAFLKCPSLSDLDEIDLQKPEEIPLSWFDLKPNLKHLSLLIPLKQPPRLFSCTENQSALRIAVCFAETIGVFTIDGSRRRPARIRTLEVEGA